MKTWDRGCAFGRTFARQLEHQSRSPASTKARGLPAPIASTKAPSCPAAIFKQGRTCRPVISELQCRCPGSVDLVTVAMPLRLSMRNRHSELHRRIVVDGSSAASESCHRAATLPVLGRRRQTASPTALRQQSGCNHAAQCWLPCGSASALSTSAGVSSQVMSSPCARHRYTDEHAPQGIVGLNLACEEALSSHGASRVLLSTSIRRRHAPHPAVGMLQQLHQFGRGELLQVHVLRSRERRELAFAARFASPGVRVLHMRQMRPRSRSTPSGLALAFW